MAFLFLLYRFSRSVCFCLNRTGSEFSGLYGLNHSDSAAHAKHYGQDGEIYFNRII